MTEIFNEQFWVACSFFIFIALVGRPFKNALINFLDERAAKITKDLSNAEKLNAESLRNLEQVQLLHDQAKKQAEQIIEKASKEALRIAADFEAKAEEMIRQKELIATQKIKSYENLVKENLRKEAATTAIEIVKQIINEQLDSETAAKILENSIENMILTTKKLH